jgi:hypothetical protein
LIQLYSSRINYETRSEVEVDSSIQAVDDTIVDPQPDRTKEVVESDAAKLKTLIREAVAEAKQALSQEGCGVVDANTFDVPNQEQPHDAPSDNEVASRLLGSEIGEGGAVDDMNSFDVANELQLYTAPSANEVSLDIGTESGNGGAIDVSNDADGPKFCDFDEVEGHVNGGYLTGGGAWDTRSVLVEPLDTSPGALGDPDPSTWDASRVPFALLPSVLKEAIYSTMQ